MNFVKTSLKYKQVTLTVLAIVFAIGVYSLLTMPRREDPKLTVPQGLVIAYYPGATAAQVEEQVTKKIEQYLFQYEEVYKAKTYSTTRDGVVVVNVWLNDNVKKPEIFWSKLRHQLLIVKNIELPQGVRGPIVNSDFGDTEAMLIIIESDNASYAQLNDYAKILEDNIRTIKATSKIKRIGEQKEQITAYFNSDKLAQYGISMQQIVKVLQSQNMVSPTGDINTENTNVSFYTSGYYNTLTDIESQIVGTSKSGSVVRLGDIATIKREYAEPTSNISVNGHKAMIVAIQMNEGNNIVWFGEDINKKIKEVSKQLPNGVNLTVIVDQPKMVDVNVSHFLREFLIAIVSVIIVIVLLLPFRVAAVAATAIPMTIATTFMLIHTLGIELHQVSLISLIVVLGMVVDDAIVVADNYVELLDHGVERWTAAWRSAFDLTIPIFTATITIIASFLPMLILPGAIGEFMHDLPITVTVALASSFIVAMVLTPILCFFFIRKGLHDHSSNNTIKENSKKSLLDYMQAGYDKAIDWCANHHTITIWGSLLIVVFALLLFKFGIRQRFMPYAERNQFVVELWMPTGTKLDKTKEAISRIEDIVKSDKRVISYASFAGCSAPRVYYNFAPEFPVSNYAQVLINTTSNKTTETFAEELTTVIDNLVPEGMVKVKLMQQGQPLIAPVEVRIFGDDIGMLKSIAADVSAIVKSTQGNYLVSNDFKEDYYGVNIQLKDNASRLGFTTSSVSQLVYVGFKGYPVTTMYEGDKAVDIVLRMDAKDRQSIQDLENIYLESPVTGASVPLRQIASITPEWQNGCIMHRNGIRCLTVRSETCDNVLPSELLNEIQPKIAELQLPAGYRIEYGGEHSNKQEVMLHLVAALMISLMLIFLILLFQFRNLKEVAIIMITIPLSLFGAVFGLYITGNNFGLTAFTGLISLSGIVVRNAIILIDYTNELIEKGFDIRSAAIDAGKRRLRPIFLTAMAAAIGVLPMIISGSSLWSPLASVIAFGVVWSMIMALLTVPVLYIMMMKPTDKVYHNDDEKKGVELNKVGLSALLIIGLSISSFKTYAQQPTSTLNLMQVTEMALQNNHLLKIQQYQVEEKRQKVNQDRTNYFPVVSIGANYQYNSNLSELTIPQSSFGTLPAALGGTGLPATDVNFEMGENNTYNASATFYQPISQLPKIRAGVEVSKTELAITEVEQSKATMQVKQACEKLYYGILILQKQKEEADLKLAVAKEKLYDVEGAVVSGKATESAEIGLNANVADEEQSLLKIKIQLDDYVADLKNLAGIPDSVSFALDSIAVSDFQVSTLSMDILLKQAQQENSDLKMAEFSKVKTEYAIKASKYSYLPDFGILGGYTYQEGNSLFPKNNTFVGVSFKWNIQDMFSNSYVKRQRVYMKEQAQENLLNTQEKVESDLAKAYRKLVQSVELVSVAQKVVDYRREDVRIQSNKQVAGLNIDSEFLSAKAELAKAESDLLAAQLNYRVVLTELQIVVGNF